MTQLTLLATFLVTSLAYANPDWTLNCKDDTYRYHRLHAVGNSATVNLTFSSLLGEFIPPKNVGLPASVTNFTLTVEFPAEGCHRQEKLMNCQGQQDVKATVTTLNLKKTFSLQFPQFILEKTQFLNRFGKIVTGYRARLATLEGQHLEWPYFSEMSEGSEGENLCQLN